MPYAVQTGFKFVFFMFINSEIYSISWIETLETEIIYCMEK